MTRIILLKLPYRVMGYCARCKEFGIASPLIPQGLQDTPEGKAMAGWIYLTTTTPDGENQYCPTCAQSILAEDLEKCFDPVKMVEIPESFDAPAHMEYRNLPPCAKCGNGNSRYVSNEHIGRVGIHLCNACMSDLRKIHQL